MNLPIYNIDNNLTWVFFDLDDTLWDFSANSLDTLLQLYNKYEYLSHIYSSFNFFQSQYHQINDKLWDLYQKGMIDSETVKRDRFKILLQDALGEDEASAKANVLQEEYLNLLSKHTKLVEDAELVLKELSKYFLIGILSNGFRNVQYRKLYGCALYKYVQRMVVSDEIGVNKPDEKVFRFAEMATGARPDSTLLIGDNPEADIAGALRAGWQTIYFDHKGKGRVPADVPVITGLKELIS